MRITMTLSVLAAIILASGITLAVDPPGLMNYQGVLRDDNDVPLDGTYDMVFRFYDDADPADPENEIFVDEHLASGTGAVTVAGGLFDVLLGSGNFYDGNGLGDHPHIFYVFGLHETVYLEVQVGAETLAPRMQVVSAPYAIHAVLLGGYAPSEFINTTSEEQEKTGLLRALGGIDFGGGVDDDLTAAEVTGLTGGPATYADFLHQHAYTDNADTVDNKHASEFADAVHGHAGSDITGPVAEATDADTLDGHDSAYFLNTSEAAQFKAGPLTVNTDGIPGFPALEAIGEDIGASFSTINGTGWANVAKDDRGIEGFGGEAGGYFEDLDASGHAWVGYGHHGVWGTGSTSGGFFEDFEDSGFAWIGHGDRGIQSGGTEAGGYFNNTDPAATSEAQLATLTAAGMFDGPGGRADIGLYDVVDWEGFGIDATGNTHGGQFKNSLGSGKVEAAAWDTGLIASGDNTAVRFSNTHGGGTASGFLGYRASDEFYGVWAQGDTAGGYFENTTAGGTASAYLGSYHEEIVGFPLHYGVRAEGSYAGGIFKDVNGHASVELATSNGNGVYAKGDACGVNSWGVKAGGRFENTKEGGTAMGFVGYWRQANNQYYGVWAEGDTAGAYFRDADESGYARVGYLDEGISAHGDVQGGYFERDGTGDYTHVAYGTNKVQGPGSNSFVQNHPYEEDRVLVYNSPEGDEVATYTRGTARLLGGEARVSLGDTFSWVTNPDIGLTAYVTPVGDWSDLYVAEKSATELVVRSRDGAGDVAFDYIVYGLRVGFEEVSIVQEKNLEARIPSMSDHEQRYEQHPELRSFNAFERFKGMESAVRGIDAAQFDFSRAAALTAAIEVYDPDVHGRVIRPHVGEASADGGAQEPASRPEETGSDSASKPGSELARNRNVLANRHETIEESTEPTAPTFAVSEPVEPGDLLVLDPENPGQLRRADMASDPSVIGIAAAEPIEMDGELQVEMVDSLYAVVKADATYGVILAGDLLTSSPTSGHVMVAVSPAPGEVVGKAAESLESGTGSIRVLVMPR